jgi:hypothetical protein
MTRALVVIKNNDKYEEFYQNSDGYPSHTGDILLKKFPNGIGNLYYEFEYQNKFDSIDELITSHIVNSVGTEFVLYDYIYIFNEGKWKVAQGSTNIIAKNFKSLEEVLQAENE